MSAIKADLRQTLRALYHQPLYAVVSALVLAIAIGANATVFGVFNGFFLRPLPYPDGERLVRVYSSYPKLGAEDGGTSIPEYLERRDQAPSLESLAIYAPGRRTLSGEGPPEQLSMARVSPSLFDVLRVPPALGRAFTDEEAQVGNERVVVLSHDTWVGRFGARPDVVGQDVRLDGAAFRVVGVMPRGFGFPTHEIDAWVPLAYTPEQASDAQRGRGFAASVGRLRDGATIDGLNAELDAIVRRNVERLPETAAFVEAAGFTARARPLRDMVVGDFKQMVTVLQGIVLAVLLIACANVANLTLSRVVARRKELSVRAALGASRARLARLVVGESALLATVGAIGGVGIAYGGLELVRWLGLDQAERGFEAVIDGRVLLFSTLAAAIAAVLSALLPLLVLARADVARTLNESARSTASGAAQRFRSALVTFQLAVSVALLVGGGLLAKNFLELQRQGPGFLAQNLWTGGVALPRERYADAAAQSRFFERALAELRAQAGVTAVGVTSALPFSGLDTRGTIAVDGYEPPPGTPPLTAELRAVSDGYFNALGLPVIRGRDFTAAETEDVAVIDENLARALWRDGEAIGQRVRNTEGDAWASVIGVVPHVEHSTLAGTPERQTVYWHFGRRPELTGALALRSPLPPDRLTGVVRDVIARLDPELALFDVVTMADRVERSLGPQRTPMVLLLVFAVTAFSLAVIGVYGVLTWAVTQRVGEIGVRMALGARGADVVRMVMRQGARMTVVGIVIGTVGAITLARVLSAELGAAIAVDPWIFAVVIAGLTISALLASWLPAQRAARTDPMQALRSE